MLIDGSTPVRRPARAAQGAGRRAVDPGPADRPDRRVGPGRRPVARPVGHRHPARAAADRDGRDGHPARPRQDPVAAAPRLRLRSSSTCRARISDINLAFLDASDTIIEIVTYDSTTIHNTIAMADTFRSIGYPASKVRYLVNRADSAGGIDAGRPAPGARPRARSTASCPMASSSCASNNEGVPFVLADPNGAGQPGHRPHRRRAARRGARAGRGRAALGRTCPTHDRSASSTPGSAG